MGLHLFTLQTVGIAVPLLPSLVSLRVLLCDLDGIQSNALEGQSLEVKLEKMSNIQKYYSKNSHAPCGAETCIF